MSVGSIISSVVSWSSYLMPTANPSVSNMLPPYYFTHGSVAGEVSHPQPQHSQHVAPASLDAQGVVTRRTGIDAY